jgi:predicted nucleotidyltransferase
VSRLDVRTAVETVALAFAELKDEIMLVGGVAGALLITDPAAPPPRPTADVDVVLDVVTYAAYVKLTRRLRELGFSEDTSPGAPTCRWVIHSIRVDVMSTGPHPGPSNRWYGEALAHAEPFAVSPRASIRLISAPHFLATKLEAFGDGRRGDLFSSHDIEDVVAVVDGRKTVVEEVRRAPASVADYLRETFTQLLAERDFADAVAGHLPPDDASQSRLPLVLERLRAMTLRP